MRKNWMRQRGSLPPITATMRAALQRLQDAQDAGGPFIVLPGVRRRTLQALERRDWLVAHAGLDGTRYRLTGRGAQALSVYRAAPYHADGLCARCGVRPRRVSRNGFVYSYCGDCNRKANRRHYALKGNQFDADAPCSRCGLAPRHRYPSGFVIAYCKNCRQVRAREEKRSKMARRLERIRAGEVLPCRTCGAPCHATERAVYNHCWTHHRALQRVYTRRSALKSALKAKENP